MIYFIFSTQNIELQLSQISDASSERIKMLKATYHFFTLELLPELK